MADIESPPRSKKLLLISTEESFNVSFQILAICLPNSPAQASQVIS